MRSRPTLFLCLLAALFGLSWSSFAAVVFKPGEKVRYRAPGEEEVSASARQLFDEAQAAENAGDFKRALKNYRALVRKHPKDTLASGAAYRYAVLQEKVGDPLQAAEAYRVMVENYPKSSHFDEAIEAQFRIGELYLAGKKVKIFGIPVRSAVERAIRIFAGIVRSAPYSKYTARAQFDIGRATEKQGDANAAVAAYQAVIEKYPNDPVAADAQYQIGYIWFNEARNGTRDSKAVTNARTGFQDFLFRYPKSEKTAQARENLRRLEQKQSTNAFQIAKYYDKQKNYRAAVIYYNDVIRQEPGSRAGNEAKKRIAQIRAKLGDAALQSAELTAATARPAKKKEEEASAHSGLGPASGAPPMRTSPNDVAPLPPPELDQSLPPPASMQPDTTTAPPAPTPTPTPEPSATPE